VETRVTEWPEGVVVRTLSVTVVVVEEASVPWKVV
jgi:hypothetical protein